MTRGPFNRKVFAHWMDVEAEVVRIQADKFWASRIRDMLLTASSYRAKDGSTGQSYLKLVRCSPNFPHGSIAVLREVDGAYITLKRDRGAFAVEVEHAEAQ